MPTKQKTCAPELNPSVQDNDRTTHPPLPDHRYGPHHSIANELRVRCYPHNRGSWVYSSSDIPPLQNNHHRRTNSPIILRTCISMVRPTIEDDLRSRPLVHVQLRQSTVRETRCTTKHLLSIPPANRRPFRKQEPMGRIIPETSHFCTTRRLGSMATHSDSCP